MSPPRRTGPKQRVDLDLDALAPPNSTVRMQGKVYELPGDIPIESVIRALQLKDGLMDVENEDEEATLATINELQEIIYDLFRQCDPSFEPFPLTLTSMMHILGFVLSGLDVDFESAVQGALADEGDDEEAEAADPPTGKKRTVTARTAGAGSRSGKRSRSLSSV